MSRLLTITLFSIFVTAISGCSSDTATDTKDTKDKQAASSESFETPQAVFDAVAAASKKKDYASLAAKTTSETQTMLADGFLMGAAFTSMTDKEKEDSLNKLLKEYGIDLEDDKEPTSNPNERPSLVASVEDLPGFIGKINTWIQENSDDSDEGFPTLESVSDIKVDGDAAKGTVKTERGPQPIEFRKVNGSWLVHLPMDGPPESASAMEEIEDDGTPGLGMLTHKEDSSKLRHVLAYKTKFFDDPCIVVLLMARELNDREMNTFHEQLKSGDEDSLYVLTPNVKLTFDPEGSLLFMNAWINNASLSSNYGITTDVKIDGDRVYGTAVWEDKVDEETNQPASRFDLKFDTQLVKPAA